MLRTYGLKYAGTATDTRTTFNVAWPNGRNLGASGHRLDYVWSDVKPSGYVIRNKTFGMDPTTPSDHYAVFAKVDPAL